MSRNIGMILVLTFLAITCKNNQTENNSHSRQLDDEPLIANFKYRNNGDTSKIEHLLLDKQIARGDKDTVIIDFGGGFFTGYGIEIKYYNKQSIIKMSEYSCLYFANFIIDNQEVRLDKENYNIGDIINGYVNIVAHHNEPKSDWKGERVNIQGNFKLRLLDKNADIDDANKAKFFVDMITLDINTTKILEIDYSKFNSLPKEIRQFKNLEILSASNNNIKTINIDDLASFKSLKYLNLNYNPIKDISSLMNLTTLETLNLGGTNVNRLPKTIEKLEKLTVLDLFDTKIKELPNELLNLKNLKEISLSDQLLNKKKIVATLKSRNNRSNK